jgi:4-amino-4-deoxychorismate lyase
MPAESPFRDRQNPGFGLIETMRWTPGEGFARRSLHLARLLGSARELDFRCDRRAVEAALDHAVAGESEPRRVRLELGADGALEVAARPFEPVPADGVWRLAVAATRVLSTDPLIRHKTTRRNLYLAARAEHPAAQAEEVLLRNERGEVCEGTICNLFADMGGGVLLTPPVSCGLLPGVLRAELLADGRAAEKVLRLPDLLAARQLFVGNSLRGLIRARICPDAALSRS